MAAVVLVDASDMKEYVVHLSDENAKRAATDVTYALSLLNAEKTRLSAATDQNATAIMDNVNETIITTSANGNAEDHSIRWSNLNTEILLKEYKRLKPLVISGHVSNKKCWDIVANALRQNGLVVTSAQCASKFNALKRTYRGIKKHMEKTGQSKSWPFFKKMEALVDEGNNGEEDEYDHEKWRGEGDLPVELIEIVENEAALAGEESGTFRWPHEGIMLLIEEAMKIRQLCESGVITQKKCWERVAEALKRHGHGVSARQCMTKFQCLRRTYKSINEYNEKVERGEGPVRRRMEWTYFDIVGKLLKDSWTCTLNTSGDNDDEKVSDLDNVQVLPDSREMNGLNETEEKRNNAVENNSHDTAETGSAMECDYIETDTGPRSPEAIDDSRLEKENETKINDEPKWCYKSTRLLLAEIKERRRTSAGFGSTAFLAISNSLRKKGFPFSPAQVENRWQSLVAAFRAYSTGKSSPTIPPYYAELRNIFLKRTASQKKPVSLGKVTGPWHKVLDAKPPMQKSIPSDQAGVPTFVSDRQPMDTLPNSTNGGTGGTTIATDIGNVTNRLFTRVGGSRPRRKSGTRSRLKEDALSMLRELKQEIARQNREIERQNELRETYCNKLIAQNEVMIKQRERRNELLEELVRLRRSEVPM